MSTKSPQVEFLEQHLQRPLYNIDDDGFLYEVPVHPPLERDAGERLIMLNYRKCYLLNAEGEIVANDDPEKFDKAVHLSSIHVDKGLHCVDCHFTQDNHGNGHLYGEVASAIEIECKDCHGTAQNYPDLRTSGPAAPPGGSDMRLYRNSDGQRRFEWRGDKLIQRSALDPAVEWELSLVKDTVNPEHDEYNAKAARAKLMGNDVASQDWGLDVAPANLAHKDEEIECYTCHTSWITSCAG